MAKTAKASAATAAKKPAAEKPAKAAAPAPAPVSGPVAGGTLKTKDLLDRAAARAGASKKQTKAIMDAVLQELGESLGRGEGFALPLLGRGRVSRSTDAEGGQKLVIRLKRGGGKAAGPQKDGETPLAPEED